MKVFELPEEAGSAARNDAVKRGDFEVFTKLPTELRLKIWGMAPEGRIVEVRFDQYNGTYRYILVADSLPIMRACTESRQEGLTLYRHFFHSPLAQNTTFFNPKIDTFSMTDKSTPAQRTHFKLANMNDLNLVENVLLPTGLFPETFEHWDLDFVRRYRVPFKSLQTLTFVEASIQSGCTNNHDDRVFIKEQYSEGLPEVAELDATRVHVACMKVMLNEHKSWETFKVPVNHFGKLCMKRPSSGGLYA